MGVRMKPQDVSRELARIAMTIESEDRPSLSATGMALRRVLASVSRENRTRRIAAELLRLAAEDVESSLWDMDEGADAKFAWKAAENITDDPKKLSMALKSLKADVDSFIDELLRDPSAPKPSKDDGVFTSAPARGDIGKKPEPPAGKGPSGPPPKR